MKHLRPRHLFISLLLPRSSVRSFLVTTSVIAATFGAGSLLTRSAFAEPVTAAHAPTGSVAAGVPEEPVETDDEAPPKILLATPSAPLTGPRTYHRHDGFYLRTNLGLSLVWANIDDAGATNTDFDVSGAGMGIDLLIGGTPTPGFTIGGGIIGNWSFGAEFEREGEPTQDRNYQDATIGVFVDGFPRDTGPWHIGGLVGLTGVNVREDATAQNTVGLGGAVWAGYDQWVADDWSLGGQVRFGMSQTSGEDSGYDVSSGAWTLGFMFSALYH